MGLKEDGTVIATGDNSFSQCDVSAWANVSFICCGNTASFSLTKDGEINTTDRNFKSDNNYRLIPRKYVNNEARKLDTDVFFSGRLLIVNQNNTIEVFGDNLYDVCDNLMEIANNTSTFQINNIEPTSEKEISDLVLFNSVMMKSVSDQINTATDLTTTSSNRAILAALLSLEFANQKPDFKIDYSLPIYVCKQDSIASVAVGGEKDYALVIFQMNPLSTSYGIFDGNDPDTIKATLDATNENVWQVPLDEYNEKLAGIVDQIS